MGAGEAAAAKREHAFADRSAGGAARHTARRDVADRQRAVVSGALTLSRLAAVLGGSAGCGGGADHQCGEEKRDECRCRTHPGWIPSGAPPRVKEIRARVSGAPAREVVFARTTRGINGAGQCRCIRVRSAGGPPPPLWPRLRARTSLAFRSARAFSSSWRMPGGGPGGSWAAARPAGAERLARQGRRQRRASLSRRASPRARYAGDGPLDSGGGVVTDLADSICASRSVGVVPPATFSRGRRNRSC